MAKLALDRADLDLIEEAADDARAEWTNEQRRHPTASNQTIRARMATWEGILERAQQEYYHGR